MTTCAKQQTETATLCRIATIAPEHISRKLRVAGRSLMYQHDACMMLLADGESAVLVDLTLCLNPFHTTPWLRENNSLVIVIGWIEELESPNPPIALPLHARPVEVDLKLILRALSIRETALLDLELWNKAISMRERGSTDHKNWEHEYYRVATQ